MQRASWRTFEHGEQVQGTPQEDMPSFGAWRCDASREQVVAQLFLRARGAKVGQEKVGQCGKVGQPKAGGGTESGHSFDFWRDRERTLI